jgi:hypothetical protein
MGRNFIRIAHIADNRARQARARRAAAARGLALRACVPTCGAAARAPQITFTKRKNGLMKKAMELSVLCGADVVVVLQDEKGRHYHFGSKPLAGLLARAAATKPTQSKTAAEVRPAAGAHARTRARKRAARPFGTR